MYVSLMSVDFLDQAQELFLGHGALGLIDLPRHELDVVHRECTAP
jgi:hypothetical protein